MSRARASAALAILLALLGSSGAQAQQRVGEGGCQYEMPLEAAYRFLVDPEPYADVRLARCATSGGTEEAAGHSASTSTNGTTLRR